MKRVESQLQLEPKPEIETKIMSGPELAPELEFETSSDLPPTLESLKILLLHMYLDPFLGDKHAIPGFQFCIKD